MLKLNDSIFDDTANKFMHKRVRTSISLFICALATTTMTACGWVDSTGLQGTTGASLSSAEAGLRNAQPVALLEETPSVANLVGEGSGLQRWTWTLNTADAQNHCGVIDGFDTSLSVTSLQSACTSNSDCTVAIEESMNESGTQFTLRLPQLRAPVALNYIVSTTRDDGATINRQQYLCGQSINEAPQANDDHYIAMTGEQRIVNAHDPDNLLQNDIDDEDLRNQPLQVVTTVVQMPEYAAHFSLDSNGGFIYQPQENIPHNGSGYVEDKFVYAITDGSHTVNATAFIQIIDGNQSPLQAQQIPDYQFKAANNRDNSHIQLVNLAKYFNDPDGDALTFSIDPNSLPASGNITLSPNGLLHAAATSDDLGDWQVNVVVSDGIYSISDDFIISIKSSARNNPPTATDIQNQLVFNTFDYDVSGFFYDADGDTLEFSATGLPANVSISPDGLISGTAGKNSRGTWFIWVTADDGASTVSDGFLLVIL